MSPTLAPLPIQQPRPVVWIGGAARGALQRASRWDGYTAGAIVDESGEIVVEPAELRSRLEVIGRGDDGFDVAVVGVSEAGDDEVRDRYASAGATWWLECIHDGRGPLEAMLERVRRGP